MATKKAIEALLERYSTLGYEARLASKEKDVLKAQIFELLGEKNILEGKTFMAVRSFIERSYFDKKAVELEMGSDWIEERSNKKTEMRLSVSLLKGV